MKKILVFSAAIAALSLTSCNKEDAPAMKNNVQNEICAVNVTATKGYVIDNKFEDTPYDEIHDTAPSANRAPRTMLLSAYLTPQDSKAVAGDYFVAKEFAKGDTDELWHANPKVYWPLGGTLDFLAVSTKEAFPERNISWDKDNASDEVVIYVTDQYTQDDIIFAGTTGKKVAETGANPGNVALTFNHAQAWIEFQLKVADTESENLIHVKDITIENVYKQGELTIIRRGSSAEAEWSFRGEIAKDALMEDTFGVTVDSIGSPKQWNTLTDDVQYMDMLLPEQEQTSFVMTYVLAGQPDVELTYRYDLTKTSTVNWEMGKKYVYEINCTISEITVTPSVVEFAEGTVTNFEPNDLR